MVSLVTSATAQTSKVTDALRQAADQTGVSFDYLLRTATRESSLNPAAKAPTSSASGLFQFIEQTWLSIVKEAGAKFGFARESQAIDRQSDGRLTVTDAGERQRILSLRNDPGASAVFGAAFTQRNFDQLSRDLGRQPDAGETYLAHVLGAGGASRFLNLAQKNPNAPAASSFAEAAKANASIFYGPNGEARSFRQVAQYLTSAHQAGSNPIIAAQEAGQQGNADQGFGNGRGGGENGVFLSLFQTDQRGPVSKLVQSLWGQGGRGAGFAASPARPAFFPSIGRGASQSAAADTVPALQPVEAGSSTVAPRPAPGAPLNLLFFVGGRG